MAARVSLLVGTRKGAFIYTSDERRERWELSEPMLRGWQVFHIVADTRETPARLYAGANSPWWGPSIACSTDGGATWDQRNPGLAFPDDMGIAVENVWHIRPGLDSQPGVVYAGVDPAGLFRSDDWGVSWTPVDGINRHELRPFWRATPGTAGNLMQIWLDRGEDAARRILDGTDEAEGGLTPRQVAQQNDLSGMVHSIEIDPRDGSRMYVAISAGGAYATSDGGERWEIVQYRPLPVKPDGRMLVSQAAAGVPAEMDPAAAFDMHTMRMDPKNPDRLWTQAHSGVFRSDDGGETWVDASPGPPAYHGFPIAVTRHAPDAAYVVPLVDDDFRVAGGQLAVLRTRDGGASWDALTDGLPGPYDYQSVYREGLDTDGLDPEGVYAGTSNGQVYASSDGGDHWQRLPGTLPPVLSVTCAVTGG